MQWQSNSSPQQPPTTSSLMVPSAEAVRQAALEASWRRDKRVAQRRLFWRWTFWYVQRFYVHGLVLLALLIGTVYFSAQWFARPLSAGEPASALTKNSAVEPAASPDALAPTRQQPIATSEPDDWVGQPLTLLASSQLHTRTSTEINASAPNGPPDTLPLKPETWLHSKEP